jgi:hypothetical protein
MGLACVRRRASCAMSPSRVQASEAIDRPCLWLRIVALAIHEISRHQSLCNLLQILLLPPLGRSLTLSPSLALVSKHVVKVCLVVVCLLIAEAAELSAQLRFLLGFRYQRLSLLWRTTPPRLDELALDPSLCLLLSCFCSCLL